MAFRDVALDRYIWYYTAVTVTDQKLHDDSHGFLFTTQKCTNSNLFELNRKCSRYCHRILIVSKIKIQETVRYYKLYVFEICSNQWFEILKNCYRLKVHLFLDFKRFKWTFEDWKNYASSQHRNVSGSSVFSSAPL